MTMERRLLLAMVLAVGVLVIWQLVFPPVRPEPQPQDPAVESLVEDGAAILPPDEGGRADVELGSGPPDAGGVSDSATMSGADDDGSLAGAVAAGAVGEDEVRVVTLETEDVLVMVSNRGGRVQSWKLKGYKDDDGRNLELIPDTARTADILPLELILEDADFAAAAAGALYKMERGGDDIQESSVTLTWSDGAGREVRKVLTVGPGFSARVDVEVLQDGRLLPSALTWGAGFGVPAGKSTFSFTGRALLAEQPKPRRITADSLEEGEIAGAAGRQWGGLEDTYFTALFLPPETGTFTVVGLQLPAAGDEDPAPALQVALDLPAGDGTTGLYVGPKDYRILKAMGRDMQEAVHFQSGIWVIGPLVTLLSNGLFKALIFLHENVVANWGWSIVLLTAAIKFLFWPITQKSMLSMKRMQEKTKRVQPKVAALKEKYRRQGKKDIDSRGKMNQEVMALYQKEGINPMGNLGGCLPLLLQMPILYGFYNLLQVAIELRQAPWLGWVQDLSVADPYYILPVVMGGSMVYQQVLTGAAIADPAQRRMMYMTPVLFTMFFLNLPSGLVLYWLVNNLLGIVQQYFINRRYALETAAAALEKATPHGRKP
jgi:YidC/Oxa1 family membrane protein insertase